MLPPGAILKLKIHQNSWGRGFAPDPTGRAYIAPQIPSWFSKPIAGLQGTASRQEGGNKGKRREGELPHFIVYNLTTV